MPLFRLHDAGITAVAQPIDKIAETITGLITSRLSEERTLARAAHHHARLRHHPARLDAQAGRAAELKTMASVELVDISKSYGAVEVIAGLNLAIDDGSFTVFVGPSGCGKSTLLRMVAGLEPITRGEVRIGGRRVNEADPIERGVAMVFQNYALYPHMTVEQNIGFSLKMAGLSKQKIAEQRRRRGAHAAGGGTAQAQARPALRRPAPARRHRARDRARRPRSSCSTSRSPTSMPNFASRCASRSPSFTSSSARR